MYLLPDLNVLIECRCADHLVGPLNEKVNPHSALYLHPVVYNGYGGVSK